MYEVYAAFAYLVLAMLTLEFFGETLEARANAKRRPIIVALVSLSLTFLFAWVGGRPFLTRSATSATVHRPSAMPPYFTVEDREIVASYLTTLANDVGPVKVQVLPEADALLFADLRGDLLEFRQPTWYEGRSDVYVVHDSVWLPELVRNLTPLRMAFQQGIPLPLGEWLRIHERDGTESWRVYRFR
jgi:hypothetical protein